MAKRRSMKNDFGHDAAGINSILQVAVEVGQRLELLKVPYCFIGGVAYQRWGEPRQTVAVDATLFVGFGIESAVVDELLSIQREWTGLGISPSKIGSFC